MQQDFPFSAAVFAGGASTRMGTDKAFLRFGDELLIERQLRSLRDAGAAELFISGRAGVDYSRFALTVVHDERPDAGPLAGLAAVLKAARFEKTMILAVDMPAMTPAMLRKLISLSGDGLGCVPLHGHGYEPLAAAYPRELLPFANAQLAEEKYSMQDFVERALARGLVRTHPIRTEEKHLFANCNRPSDLEELLNQR